MVSINNGPSEAEAFSLARLNEYDKIMDVCVGLINMRTTARELMTEEQKLHHERLLTKAIELLVKIHSLGRQ